MHVILEEAALPLAGCACIGNLYNLAWIPDQVGNDIT